MPDDTKYDSALQAAKDQTRAYAKSLWSIIARYGTPDKPQKPAKKVLSFNTFESTHPKFLKILTSVPYLLALLFVVSFFWDFDGVPYLLFGHFFHLQGLLRILSVSGLIGFLTNWIAITMLFKPAQKRPLLGQGLIPAQKDRIAFRLAQAVSNDLINPEIIKQKIHSSNIIHHYRKQSTRYIKSIVDDPSFRADLKQWMVHYVDDMIANPEIRTAIAKNILLQIEVSMDETSIERIALKAYSFIKGQKMQEIVEDALRRIPQSIETGLDRFDTFLDDLPVKLEEHSAEIEEIVTSLLYKLVNQLNVHALVEDKLRQYDEQHIAEIILKATNEQLQYIQYLGAILGVIGGFVIWEPFASIITLATLLVLIFLLDHFLYKLQNN